MIRVIFDFMHKFIAEAGFTSAGHSERTYLDFGLLHGTDEHYEKDWDEAALFVESCDRGYVKVHIGRRGREEGTISTVRGKQRVDLRVVIEGLRRRKEGE